MCIMKSLEDILPEIIAGSMVAVLSSFIAIIVYTNNKTILQKDEWRCSYSVVKSGKKLVGVVPNQRMIDESVEVCIEYSRKQ